MRHNMCPKSILLLAFGVMCAAPALETRAEDYPVKSIRMLVPYPAGGGADSVARLVAAPLSERLGQQVFVDDRGGAGGTIGAGIVAKAAPDGYTILLAASNLAWSPSLFENLNHDPARDFAAVSLLAETPSILAVNPSLPVNSVQQLIALAKAKPGTINYAGGVGTSMGTDTELLKASAGIDLAQIPYRGTGPAVLATLSGEASVIMAPTMSVLPYVRKGSLRALATSGQARISELPELPTVAESGVPGFETYQWYGVFAPARTPRPIIDRLNRELVAVLRTSEVTALMNEQALITVGGSPKSFAAFYAGEIAKWARILKPSGTPPD